DLPVQLDSAVEGVELSRDARVEGGGEPGNRVRLQRRAQRDDQRVITDRLVTTVDGAGVQVDVLDRGAHEVDPGQRGGGGLDAHLVRGAPAAQHPEQGQAQHAAELAVDEHHAVGVRQTVAQSGGGAESADARAEYHNGLGHYEASFGVRH